MKATAAWFGLCLCAGVVFSQNETPDDWKRKGREDLQRAWGLEKNWALAKNAILMIGDGLGLSTITAGRMYKGQKMGMSGEEYKLSFETFPSVALSKTYNQNHQVPDSAGTANAMLTGVKTNMGNLGLTANVPFAPNCSTYEERFKLQTILDFALAEGKSVGIVTTTRVTHATPGAAYAHTPYRDWESDTNMRNIPGCEMVKDIAYQLIMDNPGIQVILGGGKRSFHNRDDGLDLVQEWKNDKSNRGMTGVFVENRQELEAVDLENTDFLMGGRIDHAHHDNFAKKALEDVDSFDEAVIKADQITSDSDTLIVVTADHSHVFSQAGYPTRGNDVLGIVDLMYPGEEPDDGLPYLTLGYLNGPASGRIDYTNIDTTADNFQQPGCVQMPWETHSGEDVGIYAKGPMSHLFHTTHEQSYIGHVLMHATCLGLYQNDCNLVQRLARMAALGCDPGTASHLSPPSPLLTAFLLVSTLIYRVLYSL